jgi:hypothetical protein
MRLVKLTNSIHHFIVDDEDYERCRLIKWSLHGASKKQIHGNTGQSGLQLPNFLMKSTQMYDHKDRDYLNNQKYNFRLCTPSQNGANKEKYLRDSSSQYKGVSYCQRDFCWRAFIKLNQKSIALGTFPSEIKAARAYNRAAIKYFGEFACLNQLGVKVS